MSDLISRSELKKHFAEGAYTSKGVREVIDNAPTVDINTELSVAYLKGRRQGQSDERPKGEWIKSQGGYVRCNLCHKAGCFGYHYCPECGADMRKGGTV